MKIQNAHPALIAPCRIAYGRPSGKGWWGPLEETGRRRLLEQVIPRLEGTEDTRKDRRARQVLSTRLAIYAAKQVVHLIDEKKAHVGDRKICKAAIAAAEAWVTGDATRRVVGHAATAARNTNYRANPNAACAYAAFTASAGDYGHPDVHYDRDRDHYITPEDYPAGMFPKGLTLADQAANTNAANAITNVLLSNQSGEAVLRLLTELVDYHDTIRRKRK